MVIPELESEKSSRIENLEHANQPPSNHVDCDEEYSVPEQRKIIHRIDRRLISMCGLAFCLSLIDRTNLSMAAVAG